MSSMTYVTQLLRRPGDVSRACATAGDLRAMAAVSLACIAVGGGAFGGVIGSFRGGVQIPYAAIKVPLAMIATLAICAPAFHGVAFAFGKRIPMTVTIALAMAAAARASLALLAFAPLLWLSLDVGVSYHGAAVFAAALYALAGLAALGLLLRGLGEHGHGFATAAAFVLVFLAAGGQTSWILRPYLVRPRTTDVPFLRSPEGGFSRSVVKSTRSAAGIFDRCSGDSVDPSCGDGR